MATYWEERARILAERDAEIAAAEKAPKRTPKQRAEVESQPAAETPADAD